MPSAQGRHAWGAMVAAYGPYLAPHVNLLATQRTYSGSFQTLSPAAQKEFQAQRSRLLTPLAALARELHFLPGTAFARICY